MASGLQLHEKLCALLGTRFVYFQPPASVTMRYPCIVYNLRNIETKFADNAPYSHDNGYEITIIDEDPDSDIPNRIKELPKCRFTRFYVADNLNHWVFSLFY